MDGVQVSEIFRELRCELRNRLMDVLIGSDGSWGCLLRSHCARMLFNSRVYSGPISKEFSCEKMTENMIHVYLASSNQ